jgi:polyphosphate kinase 2 (PPK2 family)
MNVWLHRQVMVKLRSRQEKMRPDIASGMNPKDMIVVGRPTLAKIESPSIEFADYERRLGSMQSIMQSIQQAYLGTQERAVIVLEGWDTAGKGGIVAGWGGH